MSFPEWRRWYSRLPLTIKWFVWLILSRPIIDNFWSLKHISVFLSPLNIVGAITPLILIACLTSRTLPSRWSRKHQVPMVLWMTIVVSATLVLVISLSSIPVAGRSLLFVTPFLLFFYLRRVVRYPGALYGLLYSYLMSSVIAVLQAPIAYFVSPETAFSRLAQGRGGGLRFSGGFADVMSFGMYITGSTLIVLFFYLHALETKPKWKRSSRNLVLLGSVALAGLLAIKHTTSWLVFFFLVGLFLVFAVASRRARAMGLVVVLVAAFLGPAIKREYLDPLLSKEYRVMTGEAELDSSFNGRARRWVRYFEVWSELGTLSMLFGTPWALVVEPEQRGFSPETAATMVSAGMHNDFLRILFLSGIVGLLCYIYILAQALSVSLSHRASHRYLIIGSIGTVVMYSITLSPFLYPGMMYIFMLVLGLTSIRGTSGFHRLKQVNGDVAGVSVLARVSR